MRPLGNFVDAARTRSTGACCERLAQQANWRSAGDHRIYRQNPAQGSHAKDAGRIVGRAGADGGKVGHSFRRGLVDSHLGVIEDSTDNCVNFKHWLAAYCEPTPIAWSERIASSEEGQESRTK